MLASKRIGVISVILMVAVLFSLCYIKLNPQQDETKTGAVTYANGQTVMFDNFDYYTDYTNENINRIIFSDSGIEFNGKNIRHVGSSITITAGGAYEFSGKIADGNIVVDANDDTPVRLILSGLDISSSTESAIKIIQAKKTVVSLANGTQNYIKTSELNDTAADAAIFSKDNLVFNGNGSLTVVAETTDAIKSNDGIKFMDGNLWLTAPDEAITANDYIIISGGKITVNSATDAIKCENKDDASVGLISVEGGEICINATDDGIYASSDIYIEKTNAQINVGGDAIHSNKSVNVTGGNISIPSCNEGVEGANITINDGDFNIIANDDAINAVGENSGFDGRPGGMRFGRDTVDTVYLTINGGKIYAEVRGDGIDSNSGAKINGGYLEVYGPENNGNSSMDFDGGFEINGGTVIAAGSSGMAENPVNSSSQNTITAVFSKTFNAGTEFVVKNSAGEFVVSATSPKKFDWICISNDKILTGETYTVFVDGEQQATVTVENTVSSVGERVRQFPG